MASPEGLSRQETTTLLGPSYRARPAYELAPGGPRRGSPDPGASAKKEPGQADRRRAWQAMRGAGEGKPLDADLRGRFEGGLGRDFSHVRIHTGASAMAASRALSARALTHRHHIFLGRHESPRDPRLLAHELTHVAQQGAAVATALPSEKTSREAALTARVPPGGSLAGSLTGVLGPGPRASEFGPRSRAIDSPGAVARGLGPGRSGAAGAGAAQAGTPRAGAARPAGSGAGPATGGARGAAVQRWDLWGAAKKAGGAIASGVGAVGGAVTEAAGDLLEMGRDALLAVVRRVAPDFMPLFEGDGIASFVRKLVKAGFQSLFGGVAGQLKAVFRIPGLARFGQAMQWLSTVAGQLANNDCSAILAAASRVGAFFSGIFSPVMEKVRGIASTVSGFLKSVAGALGAAVMPFLRRIGGSLWQSLKSFIGDAGKLIRRVKTALGGAWKKVKGWLGIKAEDGEHEGGGLWNWIQEKAKAVWDAIKGPLAPLLGPLKVVGGVLVMISPAGPILAVIRAWPQLKQAFDWVRSAWKDANLVVRGRAFFANTVIPTLLGAARSVGSVLEAGTSWLLGLLQKVSAGIAGSTGMGGILAPLGKAIGYVRDQFQALLAWAQGGLRSVASAARSLFARLEQYLGPVMEILKRLIAIAVNPFGIPGLLMGTLWRIIPNCLKGPVINFIVRLLSRILRALPALPQMGLLWPFLKAGMLGFLDKVLTFGMERKVKVSNKIANIIAGGSAGFALGFLKGLALGVWDAIIGPFQALVDLFNLPTLIRRFIQNLGLSVEELLAEAKAMVKSVSDKAVGTWDALVEGAKDLLANPGKVVEMVQSLLEAALSAAGQLGAVLAGKMMQLFEQPDEQIGEMTGNLVGTLLVEAVLAYFTAGSANAASAISKVARLLSRVGKAMMKVVRQIAGMFRKFLKYVGKLARRFKKAGSSAGGILGKIRGFFKRIAAWFRKILRRLFKGKGGKKKRAKRQWRCFVRRMGGVERQYRKKGISRTALTGKVRSLKGANRLGVASARVKARPARKVPEWKVSARAKVGLARLTGKRFRVLVDAKTRWKLGRRAIKKRLRKVDGKEANPSRLQTILKPYERRFRYRSLKVEKDAKEKDFNIMGVMNPSGEVAEVDDLEGLHTGESGDPIPLHWYKSPGDYSASVTALENPEDPSSQITIPMIGSTTLESRGVRQQVGIASGNMVRGGTVVTRTKSGKRSSATKTFFNLLRRHGVIPDVAGHDADHVKDLGFGGVDIRSNLWPLTRGINQRASTMGHWYSRTNMEFIDEKGGKPKRQEKKLSSSKLRGKSFKIEGFQYPPPNPGGRDK